VADRKTEQQKKQLADLEKKSTLSVYGMGQELGIESDSLKDIIKQTMVATSEKYGDRANGKVVDYFNEINFASAFAEFKKDKMDKNQQDKFNKNPKQAFKQYMSELDYGAISAMITSESGRIISYNNYKAIYTHIPEAAQALDTYKDNIMSPDDFTKMIFNIEYDNELEEETKELIEKQLDDLTEKYEIEDLADEIIGEALVYGDQYVALLSLEDELDVMLNDPIVNNSGRPLNEETLGYFALDSINIPIIKEDVEFEKDYGKVICETFTELAQDANFKEHEIFMEDSVKELVSELVNKRIHIGNKKEMLLERVSAEQSKKKLEDLRGTTDIPKLKAERNKNKQADDNKPMFLNGSSIKILDPTRVVELKIDNVVYGYYVFEDVNLGNIPNAGYLGASTGREVLNPVNMGSNLITTNNSKYTPSSNSLSTQGLSDAKVNLISKIFLDVLSKKIDKDFVRHNKEFKDFIFNLVKQDYILKKEIKMTFFSPEEIIAFKVPALYRKIIFFAKLYLATLTNMLLIKMGRAHDKRVFYVDVGADADYEQAISRVIQDIKTKEFKMDMLGEINTILNLTPGRFDDYYIPSINGERPIEIDTLAGMDIDMNNDFIEFLKDSMLSGIGVPRTLIDATKEIDFARTLSAQNANFVRNVIKYQKKFTQPFTKMYRKLYQNEYKYDNDKESEVLNYVSIDDIKVTFPSPATLNMSNLTDQIQIADQNAEFISAQYYPMDQTGSNEPKRLKMKAAVVKELLPGIDWEKFDEIKEDIDMEGVEDKIKEPSAEEVDPYAAY
jgi:hypothetical protein